MKNLVLFLVLAISLSLVGLGNHQVSALTGNDFEPGNLIDTATFTNQDSMTASQIQTFLESKVNGGQCDRNRSSNNQSYVPPWTCLFEFQENPTTGVNNYGLFEADGSPSTVVDGKSAAEIIWQAGQDHQINPQVLLVLMQTKQGLVTDNWPWTSQYSRAAGHPCSGSSACPLADASLARQLDAAAGLLRYYLDNLDNYWYGLGENAVLHHPNASCGRQTISIDNEATVALYLYTPYVPNQAALDNLYGTGDACSHYDNRNFWRYFQTWFGSTTTTVVEPPEETVVEPPQPQPTPSPQPVALTGNDFEPGNLIDTATFTNQDSMTASQIQTFLESKVNGGQCDRNRSSNNQSYVPPWTCLFEFQENPTTGVNNYGLFEADGSPSTVVDGKSAAEIIWQAGQDHQINPQVLLILLQKEQSLVTDNWPWTIQYKHATGYHCPDDSGCNSEFSGFSTQVNGAAKLFRGYLDNLDYYWYGLGENEILYHPNTECGRQTISIDNEATVALYLYTPYVPNQAALDNLYGTGDACSSYGNRNFWRYFQTWFGSTTTTVVEPPEETVVEPPQPQPTPSPQPVALTGNDFEPGNLIDTATFTNQDSMTVSQIQTFLESKVNGGQCDRNRSSNNQSYVPPWTCLFEFQENPTTGVNNYGLFEADGSPSTVVDGKSAAEIIWQAGQDHQINPQVLLVLMQTKQGLVTDNWPWTSQYSRAAGHPCSGSSACPLADASLARQLDAAASLLRYYLDNLDNYWYGLGENAVLHHPNASCGRQTISIDNEATVALYLYTPYVPNQAALDNLYGTGDACSHYDNRNFWRYFQTWFGSTTTTVVEPPEETVVEPPQPQPTPSPQPVALTGNDFEPGNLIDTATFTNQDSMTVSQIQTFLESKVNGGQCDRNRSSNNQSYVPPWTCLFEFQENPTTGVNNYGLFEADGSPSTVVDGKSAAEIIWQAGQDHQINPQVLLVLMQTKQGLVTDNWPWTSQYSRAAGHPCSGSSACPLADASLARQLDAAASLLRYYLDNLDNYWYGLGENAVLHHPNASCGRQTISIDNEATVALYLYTPYVPNQAALDNLYGTGDACSHYDNRNFWRYFQTWFGG